MLGFSNYSSGDYFDPDYTPNWTHNLPAVPDAVQPDEHSDEPRPDVHWNDIPWDIDKSEAPLAGPAPKPTAQSERALHEFSMIVDDVASRRGLKLLLQSVRTELGRLRPGGNWTSAEVAAAGKALTDATNALDLWTVMEERYFGDA